MTTSDALTGISMPIGLGMIPGGLRTKAPKSESCCHQHVVVLSGGRIAEDILLGSRLWLQTSNAAEGSRISDFDSKFLGVKR